MTMTNPFEIEVDDPSLGRVPVWQSLLYHGVSTPAVARADSAAGMAVEAAAEAVGEKVAPPLASDAEPEPDPDEQDLAETLALVSQACAAISTRLDKLRADRAQTDAILEKLSATIQ